MGFSLDNDLSESLRDLGNSTKGMMVMSCMNYCLYPAKPPQMMIGLIIMRKHQLRTAQDLAYKIATKDQDALVEEHC